MSGIITGYGLFFIEKYSAHSVRHIVPPSNALLGRQNKEVVKVFLYFFRQCCAATLTMAENAAQSASFLLKVKGLPLPWSGGGTPEIITIQHTSVCLFIL